MRKVLATIAGLSLIVLAPWLWDAAKSARPAAVMTFDVATCAAPMPAYPPPRLPRFRCRWTGDNPT